MVDQGVSVSESDELCGWFGIGDSFGTSESDSEEELGGSYLNIRLGSNGTRRSFIRCRLARILGCVGLAFINFWLVEAKVALWPPFVVDEGPGLVVEVAACFDDDGVEGSCVVLMYEGRSGVCLTGSFPVSSY